MLDSIPVSFRVKVCCLRKNNDFKMRVLMYREFTVLLKLFTHDLCMSEGHFVLVLCVLL